MEVRFVEFLDHTYFSENLWRKATKDSRCRPVSPRPLILPFQQRNSSSVISCNYVSRLVHHDDVQTVISVYSVLQSARVCVAYLKTENRWSLVLVYKRILILDVHLTHPGLRRAFEEEERCTKFRDYISRVCAVYLQDLRGKNMLLDSMVRNTAVDIVRLQMASYYAPRDFHLWASGGDGTFCDLREFPNFCLRAVVLGATGKRGYVFRADMYDPINEKECMCSLPFANTVHEILDPHLQGVKVLVRLVMQFASCTPKFL